MTAIDNDAEILKQTGIRSGRPWLLISSLVLIVAAMAYCLVGPRDVQLSVSDLYGAFAQRVPFLPHSSVAIPDYAPTVLWELRLPRVCEAMLIGALLACAGIALEGLLLNPLAEPYTLGVSAGAAVGVAIAELAGFAVMLGGLGSAAAGFVGATAAVSLVYRLARVRGRVSIEAALLAGVVVGTLLWSLIPLLLTLANRLNEQSRVLFYLIGSLQSADWTRVTMLSVVIVPVLLVLRLSSRDLNLLSFGEEAALHLGVGVEGLKRRVLLVGSLATATAVAVAGAIGFVGLVTPHMARMLCGPDARRCLPVAAVLGATMMVLADLLCRVWLNEMPVGVVTSLVGAPVFCVLLRRQMTSKG